MLRRLIVALEGCNDGGGDFLHVQKLICNIRQQRPDVAIVFVYSSKRGNIALTQFVAALSESDVHLVDLGVGPNPCLEDINSLAKIVHLYASFSPDIVHAHSAKAGTLCRLAKLLVAPSLPVIYTPHGYNGLRDFTHSYLIRTIFTLIESLLSRVSFTVNVSPDERQFAKRAIRLPLQRSLLLPLGIDLHRFRPATSEEKLSLRAQLGLPKHLLLLVAIGRASFQKNYEPLYRALNELLSRDTLLHFAHVGAGATDLAASLNPSAKSRVFTFEHLTNPEDLLRAADAFISTSRWEAISLATMEALACGVKVFLTRVSGLAFFEQLGFTGITYLDPSGAALTDHIVRTLTDVGNAHMFDVPTQQWNKAASLFDEGPLFEALFRLYDLITETGGLCTTSSYY